MILQSLWGTKKRIVPVKICLAARFLNDRAAYVLTQNEVGADLEATLNVAVRLGYSTYISIQIDISFFLLAEWN